MASIRADQYLVNARLLGEDSLTSIGTDITWRLPLPWTSQIDFAIGAAPEPHGDHHHGNREIEGTVFDAEAAGFDDVMTVANWTNVYHYNDFHQFRAGGSGHGETTITIWGPRSTEHTSNTSGGKMVSNRAAATSVGELRPCGGTGALPPGIPMRNTTNTRSTKKETTRKSHASTRSGNSAFTAVRSMGSIRGSKSPSGAEYVSGVLAAGLDERFRIGPGATFYLNEARTLKFRTQ